VRDGGTFFFVSIVCLAAYTSAMQTCYIELDYRGGRMSEITASRVDNEKTCSTAKLVSSSNGSNLVASLAKESAISFPVMSVCPGTQLIVIEAPISIIDCAAVILRI